MPTITDLLNAAFGEPRSTKSRNEKINPLVCASCGDTKILVDNATPTCRGCGRVDDQVIDDKQEWGTVYGDDGRPISGQIRCGTNTANTDLYSAAWGQSSQIETKWNSPIQVKRFAKITMCQSMHHKDRALNGAYQEIDEFCHTLPESIRHEAKILWKRFTELKLTRGVVRSGIKANCVLHACASANVRRTRKEIAGMFKIQPGDIARTYELFRQHIKPNGFLSDGAATTPSDVVVRMLNDFAVTREQRAAILRECSACEDCPELMSKTPRSVAAVVLYRNLQDKGIQKADIATKCQVSLPTLTKIEATIVKYLENKRAV